MLDVIHVVASLDPRTGGPARTVPALAAAQIDAGAYTAVVTVGPVPTDLATRHPNLPIHAFPPRPGLLGSRAACALGLADFLQHTPTRAIHAHGVWQRPLHYAARAATTQKIPLVIAPRGMLEPWARAHHAWRKKLAARLLHPAAFSTASGWHATGEQEATHLARLGLNPICSAPNGIAAPDPTEIPLARQTWLTVQPSLREARVALFYGRFHPKKRIVELIELWRSAPRPGWILLVAGIPETYSVAQLANLATSGPPHGGRVIIADGTALPPPYAIAEWVWLPSHSENFGQVVAEALAWARPVLVTDTLPWREINQAGVGACAPWSAHPEHLDRLLHATPKELSAMGVRGRDWVLHRHPWSTPARDLLTFYRNLPPARYP